MDEGGALVHFDASSHVLARWERIQDREEATSRMWFEERDWSGSVLRSTRAVEQPPSSGVTLERAAVQVLAESVVHAVDGDAVRILPWDGSKVERVDRGELLRYGDKGPFRVLAVPRMVLLISEEDGQPVVNGLL